MPHLQYANKIILAPMVRISKLPMRLLALEYGADIVYSDEIIDLNLINATRIPNGVLGTVDFVNERNGSLIFRTCPKEKQNVVLQIGTKHPERAVAVAKSVENDVAGIDVNMGCPKKFSTVRGMGAALLSDKQQAKAILTALVQECKVPVTCKVRIFPKLEDTLDFCKSLAETGISAIAVHGRTQDEKPKEPNHNDVIKRVAEILDIPVIANGGFKEMETYEDIEKFKTDTGCSSVMVARAAAFNCSIFRPAGKLPLDDVIKAYLHHCIDYNNPSGNTKSCIQYMLHKQVNSAIGRSLLACENLEKICALWNLDDYYKEKYTYFRQQGLQTQDEIVSASIESFLRKMKEGDDIIELRCAFMRDLYSQLDLPKNVLLKYVLEKKLPYPSYDTVKENTLYKSVVTVDGKKYSSSYWEMKRNYAEHGAALVCLCALNLVNLNTLVIDDCIR